jgi:cephalosporin hydroxylase
VIRIDLETATVTVKAGDRRTTLPLNSPEAFAVISRAWLRAGWDAKYVYSFTWLGRPVIQLPEDLIRVQEVVYTVKPTVIIETGVAHGGSLIFYASLLKAMGGGHVIGIDIEIRPPNRRAIEEHELASAISLIEGSSTAPSVLANVKALLQPEDRTFVMLDSNHSKQHVLDELNAYSSLVSPGSYIVAADGIMADLVGAPRSSEDWAWNNPRAAVTEFLQQNSDFELHEPAFLFNEGTVVERVTYWPGSFIRRKNLVKKRR